MSLAAGNPSPSGGSSLTPRPTGWQLARFAPAVRRIVVMSVLFYASCHPLFSPVMPGTELTVLWIPGSLLAFALWIHPRGEAPAYVVAYAASRIANEPTGSNLAFDLVAIAIEVGQAAALGWVARRHLRREQMILQPSRVVAYTMLSLLLAAIGATAMLAAIQIFQIGDVQKASELAGDHALAWRYWWLGRACSFVAVTGALGFLAQVSFAELRETFSQPRFAKGFAAMAALLTLVTAFVLPVFDQSGLGLSAEMRLGLTMIPASIAFAMTAMFLGFGAAYASLAITAIAVLSTSGPNAAENWRGMPPLMTPLHVYLTMMATTCWVIATISRQMHWARREVVEAGKMRAPFAAMLTHELRTQLDAIIGHSEQVQSSARGAADPRPIENIQASSRRLMATIEGLLGQGEHGTSVFELEKLPLRLRDTVREAIGEVTSEAEKHGCRIASDVRADLVLEADPTALRQMMLVLLSYPLRFAAPGASITISARRTGADTIVEIRSTGLINAVADDRDKIELQLVSALALAHGARLETVQHDRSERLSRLSFFATQSA